VTGPGEIIRRYGDAYRAKYGEKLLPSHRRALRDLAVCRTAALGGHVYHCATCRVDSYKYHSCRNRHCPQCQSRAGEAWLVTQQQLLLPTSYFMVTFTLPQALRSITRNNQQIMYDLLFRCAAAALQELAQDPRFVGGQIGMVGVLHTWGRDLSYHPHVHFLVAGGGLSSDGRRWLPSRRNFLVHIHPLGRLFRAKFRAALQKTALFREVTPNIWRQNWVVHSQAVGDGNGALKYLAPYIFRVAIGNRRIVNISGGHVTFRYTPSGQKKSRRCTLPAEEFLRRFLQHVLPKGFVKVRYYGLFAPGQRQRLRQARKILAAPLSETENAPSEADGDGAEPATRATLCPTCGGVMTRRQVSPVRRKPP